ncbi:MAG: hypothetical protein OXL40_13220 [Bacteroidota bacterium]|nr:hypothetical protein [Bacteroidota bacterium]
MLAQEGFYDTYNKQMSSPNSSGSNVEITQRDRAHRKLLKTALSRPGVHDMMEVYNASNKRNQEFGKYQSAMKKNPRIVTGSSSTI